MYYLTQVSGIYELCGGNMVHTVMQKGQKVLVSLISANENQKLKVSCI